MILDTVDIQIRLLLQVEHILIGYEDKMAITGQERLTPIAEFKEWKGIDNVTPDDVRLASGFVRVADNVDVDNSAMMHRRNGVLRQLLSGSWHSGWTNGLNLFAVVDGDLVEVNTDWTTTEVLADVGSSKMNFVQVGDRIFFSNSSFTGVIDKGIIYPFPEVSQTFKEKMVGGDLLEYFDARLYAAQDEKIYYSDAANPMVMDSRKNFIMVGGPIPMMHAVEDGIYTSAGGKTFFMHGADPFEFRYKPILDLPAIKGSPIVFEKEVITYKKRGMLAGKSVIFSTTDGVYIGYKGGEVEDITSKHYGVSGVTTGCSFVRWNTQHQQYIFLGEYPAGIGGASFEVRIPGISVSLSG